MYMLIGLLLLMVWVAPAAAAPYYNSSEPGCDGSDPDVLFCDGFENGSWFCTDGDHGGFSDPCNDGWGASLSHDGPKNKAAVCGAGVTPFGNCAANGGTRTNASGSVNQAFHRFKTPTCGSTSAEQCGVDEIYIRWYAKWMPGYQWGNDKNMNISNGDGDIAFADLTLGGARCGSGSPSSTSDIGIAVNYGTIPDGGACGPQNQANNITLQSGRWYFFEFHVKAGSAGLLELWVNDCGTAGTTCGAAPILRTRYGTGQPGSPVNLPGNRNGSKITMAWLENWTGIPATGTGPLWDQIKASTRGPIGFAGTSGPPPVASYTLLTTPQGAGAVTGGGSYPVNTVVTPIATANAGATFTGWSGDCTGMTCTVTMTANKAVTATFTGGTTPPPVTGCAITPTPAAITFAHPPGGPLPAPQSVRVVTSDGSPYQTFDTGFYDAAPCYKTNCPSGTLTTITPTTNTLSLAAGTYTYPLDLTAGPNCPKVSVPVVLTIGAPPAPSMGKLTVEAQVSRCNYFLTAEPPDATGGWVAQFYRDGANKVGNPIPAAPYRRSVELFAPSHSFSVDFTKTGQLLRSPAVVTRVCP